MLEVLLKRRSIRKFAEQPVSEEALQQVLQAALLAPSSRGRNPWAFIVVEDKDTLQQLGKCRHPQQAFCPRRRLPLWCWAIGLQAMCGWRIAALP